VIKTRRRGGCFPAFSLGSTQPLHVRQLFCLRARSCEFRGSAAWVIRQQDSRDRDSHMIALVSWCRSSCLLAWAPAQALTLYSYISVKVTGNKSSSDQYECRKLLVICISSASSWSVATRATFATSLSPAGSALVWAPITAPDFKAS
jgi:hypothetical protein